MRSGVWQPECPSLFPSPEQALLLAAVFGEGSSARDAFAAWKQKTGFKKYSDIDFSSSRLLPAIYRNLTRQGIDDSWLPQMAALHRYHWMKNAISQNAFLEAVQAVQQAGCKCIVLGGFGLAAGKYLDDPGERPLLEGEILVAVSDASVIRKALTELGWNDAAAAPAPVTGWRSEWWRSATEHSLRIHYRWLPKTFPVVRIDRLFERSQDAELGGVKLRICDPGDALVYACVANRRPALDLSHRFLWAFSMLRIVERGAAQLDWDRLWRESREVHSLFPLREALAYLANSFAAAVPETWLAQAAAAKIHSAEKRPFFRATRQWRNYAHSLGAAALTWPWNDYAAAEQAADRKPTITACGTYWRWHMRSEVKRMLSARSSCQSNNLPAADRLPNAA